MNRTRALLLVTAVPLLVVIGVLVSAAFGGGGDDARTRSTTTPTTASHSIVPGAEQIQVGRGPRGATIFRPGSASATAPVVVFLHGWIATDPVVYAPWISHLVHRGATVIYPTYQEPPFLDAS